jgi:glycogen debranching enzyme
MSRTAEAPAPAPRERSPEQLRPVPMAEAVGYPSLDCASEQLPERSLVLKHDRLFMLADLHGSITPAGVCSLGLFQDDTRILSHYDLAVHGGVPDLLSAQVPSAYCAQVDLAIGNLAFGGDPWDPRNVVHIRRELALADRLAERLTLTGYLGAPVDYWIELHLGCDFADIFEVRGWRREERGQYFAPRFSEDSLVFAYRGRDGRLVRTIVRFGRPPDRLTERTARWDVRLEPDRPVALEWDVSADDGTDHILVPSCRLEECRAGLDRVYHAWHDGNSRWESDVADFDSLIHRAADDLRALYVEIDGDAVISAGIPWYSTVFGRDSIITSLQTLPLQPRIAIDTLRYLARHQGRREDAYTEEQPGKILHELRRGEMARSGEIPHVPYYGSVDATPLWLILLHETWRWTGDTDLVRGLMPNAERALEWIARYGDQDGDGFVEYARTSAKGLVNQGWKDSGDGVPFPDGTLPEPPIALVEVQGYVYDAKLRMAELYRHLGQSDRAAALRKEASELRNRIRSAYWMDKPGMFAIALDGAKRPIPTATTNAGHLLWSRVPTPEMARRLTARFLQPDFFSGWGVRTLSSSHAAFNPMSYHDGSIWPHDNAILVLGMALNGHARAALPIVHALYEAGVHTDFQRLPELYCGMSRQRATRPVNYPVSCSPQAWASGSLFMLLQAMLGIYAEAPAHILHIRDPILPDFLSELTVTGLAIGRSRVALQFRRHGSRTLANLLGVDGDPLQVRLELT